MRTWESRLAILERWAGNVTPPHSDDGGGDDGRAEFRVAGRSRREILADLLSRLRTDIQVDAPDEAQAILAAVRGEGPMPEVESRHSQLLVFCIVGCGRIAPGLPQRVIEAIEAGAESVGDETMYREGRPASDQPAWRKGRTQRLRLSDFAWMYEDPPEAV